MTVHIEQAHLQDYHPPPPPLTQLESRDRRRQGEGRRQHSGAEGPKVRGPDAKEEARDEMRRQIEEMMMAMAARVGQRADTPTPGEGDD